MRKFITWLFLLTKRQLKNPLFVAIIILIPATAAIVNSIPAMRENTNFTSGVYTDGDDATAAELAESLIGYTGSFEFIRYNDLDMMYRDVKNNTLICGYVLPDDLSGRGYPSYKSESILVIHQPANTIQPSINEVVYAQLLKIQGRTIITDFVKSLKLFADGDTEYIDELLKLYDGYLHGDATFKLIYRTYGAGGLTDNDIGQNTVSFPVRGILAITVFLAGLFGGVTWMRDREHGVFATMTGSYSVICRILYALIPTMIMGIVSLITISIMGLFVSAAEFTAMLVLIVLSCVFALFMTFITRKSRTFSACIPVLLLGCFIFCNVFINAANYVPAAGFIEKIFVPYYYLRFFY